MGLVLSSLSRLSSFSDADSDSKLSLCGDRDRQPEGRGNAVILQLNACWSCALKVRACRHILWGQCAAEGKYAAQGMHECYTVRICTVYLGICVLIDIAGSTKGLPASKVRPRSAYAHFNILTHARRDICRETYDSPHRVQPTPFLADSFFCGCRTCRLSTHTTSSTAALHAPPRQSTLSQPTLTTFFRR